MKSVFINRTKAATHLKGYWQSAIAVQVVCLLTELLLIVTESICLHYFSTLSVLPLFLLADLLLLSPLKAGRAVFYKMLVTDNHPKWSHLFHFYYQRYGNSVGWRVGLWIRRALLYLLLCTPSAFFLYVGRTVTSETIAMISFGFSLILLVIAIVTAEILLFRYIPTVYLLTHTTAKCAFSHSKQLSKGYTSSWALLYLDYAGWCFSFIVLLPFLYVSPLFHTARAATVNQLISRISRQNCQQPLQLGKNRGKIRRNF